MVIDLDLGSKVSIGRWVEQHVTGGVLHATQCNDLWLQIVTALVERGERSTCQKKCKSTSVQGTFKSVRSSLRESA